MRSEATAVVVRMVVGSAASKHLAEDAAVGAHWLLSLQLLMGALKCLRLLWPTSTSSLSSEPPLALDELLPLLANQLCGTQRPLQCAAAELLSHVVASGAADVLPLALSALTTALLELNPNARVRRREALQQVSPLICRWLEEPRVARSLAPCVHRMQVRASPEGVLQSIGSPRDPIHSLPMHS